MSILDSITENKIFKEYVWEKKPDSETSSTSSPTPSQPASKPISTITSPTSTFAESPVDPSLIEKLRGKIAAAPQYSVVKQYNDAVESLSDVLNEEASRIKAAVKMLGKTASITAQNVLDAYNTFHAVLDVESEKFKNKMAEKKAVDIDSKEQQVQEIGKQIEIHNAAIKQLMEQRENLATDIVLQKQKIASATATFEGAVASLHNEIATAVQKLQLFAPSTN